MERAQLKYQHGYSLNYIKVYEVRLFQNPTYSQLKIAFSYHSAPCNERNWRIIAEETSVSVCVCVFKYGQLQQ